MAIARMTIDFNVVLRAGIISQQKPVAGDQSAGRFGTVGDGGFLEFLLANERKHDKTHERRSHRNSRFGG